MSAEYLRKQPDCHALHEHLEAVNEPLYSYGFMDFPRARTFRATLLARLARLALLVR